MNIKKLFKKNLVHTSTTDNKASFKEIVYFVHNNLIENISNTLCTKNKSDRPFSIPYLPADVAIDCEVIHTCNNLEHLSEDEFANLVATIFFHLPYKQAQKLAQQNGYKPISTERLMYLYCYITTLKNLKEFSDAGIKKYQISTCNDEKTCEKCKKHDGKKHYVEKAIIGKNAPPFCEHCRCTIIADFGKI